MSEREYQLASEYEGLLKIDTDLYYFIEDKMLSCRICHSCEQIIFTSLHLKPWGQPNFPLSSNSFFVWCWFSENVAKIIWPCRSLPPAEKSWICNWLCLLVSTYVVCERLSVMHEPARVVEILVQILQNTPILKYSFRIPSPLPPLLPPENWNLGRSWHFDFSVSEYPPPPENWNLGRSLHFDFSVSEYPPKKIEV